MRTISLLFLLIHFFISSGAQQIELSVQRGHHASVSVSAVDPDNKILASAGKDKTIKIWEIKNGREIRTLSGHSSQILDISILPDQKLLASSDLSGQIIIWNYENGEVVHSWKAHDHSVIDILFSEDELMSAGGNEVNIWDWREKKLINSYQFNGGQRGLEADVNDEKLIISGDDGYSVLIDRKNNKESDTLRSLEYSFCGGCFAEARLSPNEEWIATLAEKGPLVLREYDNPGLSTILNEKVEDYNTIAFSHDGKLLLLSLEESTEVYDVAKRELMISIPQKDKKINHAAFSKDSNSLFVSTDANEINQYDLDGNLVQVFKGKIDDPIAGDLDLDPNEYWQSYPYKIALSKNKFKVSPDGKYAIKGKTGNKAILWDIASGKPYRILKGHEKAIIAYEFSPDNKMLVTGDVSGKIIFWDLKRGDSLASRKYHFNMVLDIAFSHDGKTLSTGAYDGYLNFIDLETFDLKRRINFSRSKEYYDSPYRIEFTPNDNYVIVGSLGKKLKAVEIDSGEEFKELIGHTDVVSDIQFLSNGTMITTGWDGWVKAWDVRTGYQEWKIQEGAAINDVLIIEEKNWLITGGADRTVKIRGLKSGNLLQELKGHKGQIQSLSYLKESNILVSFSENEEVKYRDLNLEETVITQYFIGPEEWVIVNEKGFFNATERAKESVIFVDQLKSYQPGQFFNQYFNTELKPLSFSKNRSLNEMQSFTEMVKKHPVPEVEIIIPKNNERFSKSKTNILVKVTNAGGGVREIELSHNGKSLKKEISDESKVQQRGKSMMHNYELQLIPGQNVIEVSAKNKEGLASEKDKVVVELEGKSNKGKCYVLAIGINKYKNSKLNLNYAKADAESFAEKIDQYNQGLYDQIEITKLLDKEATKENILNALESIAQKAQPSDVLYLFYAGHGSMVEDEFYFIPTENVRLYDQKALTENAIQAATIQGKLKSIRALKQLIIVDACQSGAGAQTLAMRGAGNEKALAQLSRSAGVHVLASAGSDQFATEFNELGHGVFTYTLLEALNGKADGAPSDQVISVYELKSYLDANVPVYSEMHKGQPQYPYTFSIGQDFPLLLNPN